MSVADYQDLDVWIVSMDLVTACFGVTKSFPSDERYGLTSQLRRAAVSVPANIAEGNGRFSNGAYVNHLSIASGSLKELETHLLIACRLRYLSENELEPLFKLTSRVGRMLTGLKRSLSTVPSHSHKESESAP